MLLSIFKLKSLYIVCEKSLRRREHDSVETLRRHSDQDVAWTRTSHLDTCYPIRAFFIRSIKRAASQTFLCCVTVICTAELQISCRIRGGMFVRSNLPEQPDISIRT